MMPRVTTVEVAAVPPETPPVALVTPELDAPDVLSPEGVAVLTLSEAVAADVALAALAFSSSCALPPLITSWIVLSRLALPVFVTRSERSLKFASDLTEIESL